MRALLLLIFAGAFLSSCSPTLVPFSDNMVEEFDWSNQELKQIQFYLSENVVLFRNTSANSSRIENGKIKIKDGRKIEEITFKKGTPGVFIFSPKENRMAVSFESSDEKFLMFGPNPKIGNRYAILAKDWKRHVGTVSYGGEEYSISNGDGLANLLVDIDKIQSTKVRTKVVKGRQVEE